MNKLRAGIIGAGFVGPLHVEAVRRLGFVDFIAVATSSSDSARKKADALSIERAYGDYRELLSDPAIQVVHVCTPNYLHHPVVIDSLAAGKHVICDKPLAMDSSQAREMRDLAIKSRLVNAVTFNYRFNPLVQQARAMIAKGEIGDVRFAHGFYLQDWLLHDTDFSWRLEPDKAGATSAVGDIGSHWVDTTQFITGLKVQRVLASLATTIPKRRKPAGAREAFQAAGGDDRTEEFLVTSDDLGSVLVEFEGGARGVFSVGQVCPGHKNDLQVEIVGTQASIRWAQERPNEMWAGFRDRFNTQIVREPGLLDESVRRYANLPGGHNEGWADAFKNLVSNVYRFIAEGRDPVADAPDFPTFEDGYRANCVVDAIIRSNQDAGVWTTVHY